MGNLGKWKENGKRRGIKKVDRKHEAEGIKEGKRALGKR